jgi:hypothetical protein
VGVALGWTAGRPPPLSAAVGPAVGGTILFVVLLSSGRFGPASRNAWGARPPNAGGGPVGPPPIRPKTGMPLDAQ